MLIAFDPGETTGFAIFTEEAEFIKVGEIRKSNIEFYKLLKSYSELVVIIERFRLFPWKFRSLSWSVLYPIKIIGTIEGYCELLKIPFVEQDTVIKKFFTDEKLRKLKLYRKRQFSVHERDAIRHALYYLHFKLKKEIKLNAVSN